jgi:hypothetical protein
MKNTISRRRFISSTTKIAAAASVIGAPAVLTASRTDPKRGETIIGEGDHQYSVNHEWLSLPDKFSWQITHNVAVDPANNLYVIHEGNAKLKDHPSIFVFGPDGKFIRAFGSQFQGGGHGLEVRQEGSESFLYVTGYQQVKAFAKMTLTGDTVWYQRAPMKAGCYAAGEDNSTQKKWGRDRFMPTNFAFLDDGGFLLADGYGSFYIHRYDAAGNWVSCFGGPGEGEGKFNTAHGVWIDKRDGREPTIVVTDRAHNTLQIFDMDGKYLETLDGFGLPANVDTRGDLMLVPELKAQVSLLDGKNEIVARLGGAAKRLDEVKNLRGKPDQWIDGQFVHPHDACFDNEGNIFVAEWVTTGRITKLTKK